MSVRPTVGTWLRLRAKISHSQWRPFQDMGKKKGPRQPPAQKKPPLTHFLCLPLVSAVSRPQLESSLKAFRDDVSPRDPKAGNEDGIDEKEAVLPFVHPKAIRPVGALHCTLGVMSLDKEKLSEAIEFLQNLDIRNLLSTAAEASKTASERSSHQEDPQSEKSTPNNGLKSQGLSAVERPIAPPKVDHQLGPIKVRLEGLVSMHSPRSTTILYTAPTDETGRLYPFCLALQKLFKDKGLLVEDTRQLKLHATVVNTIYAKGRKRPPNRNARQQVPPSSSNATIAEEPTVDGPDGQAQADSPQGHGPNANAPLRIDATAILEKYKDFTWAKAVVLDRIAICEMGAKKILDADGNIEDEQYAEVASIPLTT